MKNNSSELILLFPTPIVKIKVPSTFKNIIPYLENLPFSQKSEFDAQSFGTRSNDSYLLNHIEFKDFKSFIENEVQSFAEEVLNIESQPFKITQSWLTYKSPTQRHHDHTHPNSLISGVFFWEDNDPELPPLYFIQPYGPSSTWQLRPKLKLKPNGITDTTAYFHPTPGTLILFPSYLPHGVEVNTSNKIRKSLAFNSIPQNYLGDEHSLTELKFN